MKYFDQIVTLSDDLKLAFPVSSKHKAGFNVIPVKFRIIIKNIFKSHSGSQPAQDIENRDSCIPDAGFSKSFFRIDFNNFIVRFHAIKIGNFLISEAITLCISQESLAGLRGSRQLAGRAVKLNILDTSRRYFRRQAMVTS